MIYSKLKILYVWEHDVSLGDSLTNFHYHLSSIKKLHPSAIIYSIVHPRTYNTGATNIFLMNGLVDYVYPIQIQKIDDDLYYYYKKALKDMDIIIHVNHSSELSVSILKSMYPNGIHLQTPESKFGLLNLTDYCGYKSMDDIIHASYHTNYVLEFKNSVLKFSRGKKSIGIFSGSTRTLANFSNIGVMKILELAKKYNIYVYLLGTSKFNIYDTESVGVKWDDLYSIDEDGVCNLIGNNWIKTISTLSSLDLILSGPTGASLITPSINKNSILITGGDSPIMTGCLNVFTDRKYTVDLPCRCINYPCHNTSIKPDEEKYQRCVINNSPACLNEEINIEDLKLHFEKL